MSVSVEPEKSIMIYPEAMSNTITSICAKMRDTIRNQPDETFSFSSCSTIASRKAVASAAFLFSAVSALAILEKAIGMI